MDDHASNNDRKYYKFIMEAGVKLEIRCTTAATAILFFHKFRKKASSDLSVCPYTAAAVCLHLAGKVEEDLIKIRDIINVCHSVLHPEEPILEISDLYWDLREGLGKLESLVLRTLHFRLTFVHPHKYLLHYLNTLESWVDRDKWKSLPVVRISLAILNDSYLDPELILNHEPQDLALAAIYLTLKIYGEDIPFAGFDDHVTWWKVLQKHTNEELLMTLAYKFMQIYNNE